MPVHLTPRLPNLVGKSLKKLDRDQTAKISIRVRPRDEERNKKRMADLLAELAGSLPHRRDHLKVEEWEARFGAAENDLDRVEKFARRKKLEILARKPGLRSVVVEGSLNNLERALGVHLDGVEEGGETYRVLDGSVRVPTDLGKTIEAVHGLETIPVLLQRIPRVVPRTKDHFHVRRVAELYDYPLEQRGKGQTAVILVLGGGYHQQDIDRYFASIGINTPSIEIYSVDGMTNNPASVEAIRTSLKDQGMNPTPLATESDAGAASDHPANVAWTIETTTNLEILGALVPEARIVLVFAPNTQDGQANAMEAILGAEFRETYGLPAVISCSWGQYEYRMDQGSLQTMEHALASAASLGVTVCFASGNFGGGQVYYPASSIYSLACGGTTILRSEKESGFEERVWREERLSLYFSASGGGASELFSAPKWQQKAVATWGGSRRGVPDVAALASLSTGYALIIGDSEVGMGGTSSAAPMLAGLVTQITQANQDLKSGYRVGWLTPLLYSDEFSDAFVSISKGDNGLYLANAAWDPCTGLGRPIGQKILSALRQGA